MFAQRQLRFRQFQQLARAALAGADAGVEGSYPGGVEAGLSGVAVAGLAAGFSAPIVSLQGAADPIVPRAMRDAVFASNARTHRIVHPSAGHLLPRTDPALCASAIRELVEQVS